MRIFFYFLTFIGCCLFPLSISAQEVPLLFDIDEKKQEQTIDEMIKEMVKRKIKLTIAVDENQDSRALLSDYKKNLPELQWIKKFYDITIIDGRVSPLPIVKTPSYKIHGGPWQQWPKDKNFPKGCFCTPGFCFRILQYDLYWNLVKLNDSCPEGAAPNIDINQIPRIAPFPKRCEIFNYSNYTLSDEELEKFKENQLVVYDNIFLVTQKRAIVKSIPDFIWEVFEIIYEKDDSIRVGGLLWQGKIEKQSFPRIQKSAVVYSTFVSMPIKKRCWLNAPEEIPEDEKPEWEGGYCYEFGMIGGRQRQFQGQAFKGNIRFRQVGGPGGGIGFRPFPKGGLIQGN